MTKQQINEIAFTAFFMGEGMIRIDREMRKAGHHKGKNYGKVRRVFHRHMVRITLRNDDSEVIDWVLKVIGGHCFYRAKRNKIWNRQRGIFTFSNPTIIWQAESLDVCIKVAELLIENPIPSKKKEEAKFFLEYAKLKKDNYVQGKGYPKKILGKFDFYHQKLKELKRYKEQ